MKNPRSFDDDPPVHGEDSENVEIVLDTAPATEYILTTLDRDLVFDLGVCENGASLDAFQPDVFHLAVQIDIYQVEICCTSRKIIELKRDTKDRICIINLPLPEDIARIQDIAIRKGAKAFIVKIQSKTNVDVPVFVVPVKTLEKMGLLADAQMNIQPKQVRSVTVVDNVIDESSTLLDDCFVADSDVEDGSDANPKNGHNSRPIDLINATEFHPLEEQSIGTIDRNESKGQKTYTEPLTVPRYSVSLFAMDNTKHNNLNKWELEATCSHSRIVESGPEYNMVWISDLPQETGYIREEVGGCVGVCKSSDASIITKVRNEASLLNAIALFAGTKPLGDTNFPVFIVDKRLLDFVQTTASVCVSFDLQSIPASSLAHQQELSRGIDYCKQHEPTISEAIYDTVINEDDIVESHVDRIPDARHEKSTYADVARSTPEKKGFFKGVLDNAVNKAADFLDAVKKPFTMQGPFLDNHANVNVCYISALKKFEDVGMDQATTEGKQFVKDKKYVICLSHFVALTYICNKTCDEDLVDEVLRSLGNYKPFNHDAEFLTMATRKEFGEKFQRPQIILYQFLVNNVDRWAGSGKMGEKSRRVVVCKGIILLSKSGLTRKKINKCDWESLTTAISSIVFSTIVKELVRALGEEETLTLTLYFQKDFFYYTKVLENQRLPTVLNGNKLLLLQCLVENHLEKDVSSATTMWLQFGELASKITISKSDTSKLFSTFVTKIGLECIENMNLLSELVVVAKTQNFLPADIAIIATILIQKFERDEFCIDMLDHLFSLPLSDYIYKPNVLKSIKEFVSRAMRTPILPGSKLKLLDLIYSKVTADKLVTIKDIVCLLEIWLMSKMPHFPVLCEILNEANFNPNLFFLKSDKEENMRSLASMVMKHCLQEIKTKPLIIHNIPVVRTDSPRLVNMIIHSLHDGLKHSYRYLSQAAEFYNEVLQVHDHSSVQSVSPGLQIAQSVFLSALIKWKPLSLTDISPEYKLTIDVIFSMTMDELDVDDAVPNEFMEYRTLIENLARTWITLYQKDNVALEQIIQVEITSVAQTWNMIDRCTTMKFPHADTLRETLEGMDKMKNEVQRMLIVDVDDEKYSLSHILSEYNCTAASDVEHLIQTYADDQASLGMTKTMNDFRKDFNVVNNLMEKYHDVLFRCASFLRYKSLLFRDAVIPRDGVPHTIKSLSNYVVEACKRIQGTIGPEMHYLGVVNAMKILNTTDAINSEIEVLQKSNTLQITATDRKNFHTLAFLWDLSIPLMQFIHCCDMFEFAIATTDKSFVDLRSEVNSFYMAEMNPIHTCLRFFDRLVFLLCSNDTFAAIDEVEQVKKVLKWVSLLGDISQRPELWKYVGEMEWFGDDGLKRFYEEYSNVTNVLLGHTQSYEMSLLTSVEPVVRILSIVGKCRNSITIFDLFRSFESNRDILSTFEERTIANHFHQVHAKLSEIKDWFSNGVDEVAASHSMFIRAVNFGKFLVMKTNEQYMMALVVKGEDDKCDSTIAGSALDHFILQLSLIQNESAATSCAMETFIEQFQVLKAASRNFIEMETVGFSTISASDFECRTGQDYMNEAKILFDETEEHMHGFKTWLTHTRWKYKVSMLFWTEELRDICKSLSSVGDNIEHVKYSLFRLHPLWKKETFDARHCSLRKFMAEYTERCNNNTSFSWLEEVSHFIEDSHVSLADNSKNRHGIEKSEIILHSICCSDEEETACSFAMLTKIYKDRLPYQFEVLDGSVPCNKDRLDLFLDRVKAFPLLKFTIVNADRLESKNLEALLSFLSDRGVESMGIRLFCVQRGDSLIHTSPWIEGKSWSRESLLSSTIHWNTEVKKYTSVVVVASVNCSSGKTHFIRRKMKDLGPCFESATITIHEMSSVSTLVQALRMKLCNSQQNCAIHFSFSYFPTDTRNKRWLVDINHFFFALITLRSVYDPISECSISMTGKFSLFIEVPSSTESANCWLRNNIPIIASFAEYPQIRIPYEIDQRARRVCTYLRAYDTGTIDRRYIGEKSKRIVLVLDTSGSMAGSKFAAAITNAVAIFDSHIVEGDEFGVILFSRRIHNAIPIQEVVESKFDSLRQCILNLRFYGGGTSMYSALSYTITSLQNLNVSIESWVVCLTDGVSDKLNLDNFQVELRQSSYNLHLITVGIELQTEYEQAVRDMCQKYSNFVTKGFFVRAVGTAGGMDDAFNVVKSKIPVSQTFDRDGAMSDDECRNYMAKYMPTFISDDDMISQSFWVRFLYRRVIVFDKNESFNYNKSCDNLGSSLMKIMLLEVERLLSENQQRDWQGKNYIQLIYDFTVPDIPEFRLVCTAPDDLTSELKTILTSLDLPGFRIPNKLELENRTSLDLFLSLALGVPRSFDDDGLLKIRCIDDNGFVLTIDFTMKLLCIHERIACKVPCLIEGETGVSKTALTKMYSILRNHSMTSKAHEKTVEDLCNMEQQLKDEGYTLPDATSVYDRLDHAMENNLELTKIIVSKIEEKASDRSSIFVALPPRIDIVDTTNGRQLLEFFNNSVVEKTFFDVNVDASLTESDFVIFFEEVNAVAAKISDSEATVVVFLDEINTSAVLGLLKEIVMDHSFSGCMLMENVVVIGACNPPRAQIQTTTRERDLGRTWACGHYQVSELPLSMKKIKWSFGALSHSQEKEFIYRRMEVLHGKSMSSLLRTSLTEIVSTSHELIRRFAKENISDSMRRSMSEERKNKNDDIEKEAMERARSVVSLRDIQRIFALYSFFIIDMADILHNDERERSAMLLSIAIVYYLRLDTSSREKFLEATGALPTELGKKFSLVDVLCEGMDLIVKATEIPVGIAMTRGLKENIFATLVCSLSQTPLIIVGPPGASKTLAVHVVGDNASGLDSNSAFYTKRPRLSLFHYQCSKKSTSKEIAAVFNQASERQDNVDPSKNRCVVFMDEAGLPEEEKESLKVLHYLLEGHMSAKAKVGFVAISNHILDAAKSNRCAMLLRQDPDEEEMLAIALGVLFDVRQDGQTCAHDVEIDGKLVPAQQFAACLCTSYTSLLCDDSPILDLKTFFGLRDFIFLLKAIRSRSLVESTRLITTKRTIVCAIERNFNGVTDTQLRQVTGCFFNTLTKYFSTNGGILESYFRDPLTVLKEALQPDTWKNASIRSRFKLVIDCTEDDSILRLLSKGGIVEMTPRSLYKLSNLPDDVEFERIRLVSSVKFAAMQGSFAVLSQTEPVNESFYDLFNQRFHELTKQDGTVTMYANIAVGGVSRRSLVQPTFECIVHIRESNLLEIPAPFLNRFEKYRLTLNDVFVASWSKFRHFTTVVIKAKRRVEQVIAAFDTGNDFLCWIGDPHTIESIFIDMLPCQGNDIWNYSEEDVGCFGDLSLDLNASLISLLERFTSLRGLACHVEACIQMACKVFSVDTNCSLEHLFETSKDDVAFNERNTKVYILSELMQMVLTRIATFRIIQLCTPETVFINRASIPSDVIQEYFNQQHFSLKQLLSNLTLRRQTETQLTIVHTRSDHLIHAIPCISVDGVGGQTGTADIIRKLIHDRPDTFIIQHLNRFRSENMVRGSIQAWLAHETRVNYIMLVDMSHSGSVDQANYIRMQVEQYVCEKDLFRKSFILLLHYPPSSSLHTHCYPALFLGGWEHMFLDSVGDSSVIDVDSYILYACTSRKFDVAEKDKCVQVLLTSALPRTLPHLVSQSLFYRDQNLIRRDSFTDRKIALTRLLAAKVDTSTFEKILCEKFAEMWFDHILMQVIRRSSLSLVNGTTQLSLTTSVHSTMVHIFQAFLSDALVQANQWKNLDLISCLVSHDPTRNTDYLRLFEVVMRELPTLPFEELMLQRQRLSLNRLVPLPIKLIDSGVARFPFFHLISAYLDEFTDKVVESMLSERNTVETPMCSSMKSFEVIQQAMTDINDLGGENQEKYNRRKLAIAVINFVMQNPAESQDMDSMFNIYLQQYIEWKVGCASSSTFVQWWTIRLQELNDIAINNIVAIHVVARMFQMDILKIASFIELMESMNESWYLDIEDDLLTNIDICDVLFQSIELQLTQNSIHPASLQWPLLLSSAFYNTSTIPQRIENIHLAKRLRCLGLLCLHPDTHGKSTKYDDTGTLISVSVSLSSTQGSADATEETSEISAEVEINESTVPLLLERFLSPTWLRATQYFLPTDTELLFDAIEKGIVSRSTAVGLLKSASWQTSPGLKFHGFSATVLLRVNGRLAPGNLAQFQESGERRCLPHFIPKWLQSKTCTTHSTDSFKSDYSTVYLAEYQDEIKGEIANVLFDLFLSIFATEASFKSSADLFLILWREMDLEANLNRQAYTQLARLRNMGTATSLQGSHTSMIAISARIVCFVAKVAYEIATDMKSSVLLEAYANEAIKFLDELMGTGDSARWQDFFISTILRLRGEGTLSSLLRGPLVSLRWCEVWAGGIPEGGEDLTERLRHAEASLVHVRDDEQWKTQHQLLCPHCGQIFSVAAVNCGSFVCGRDFHLHTGRPVVDGVEATIARGCSREFHLHDARRYQMDETKIAVEQALVDDIHQKMNRFTQCSGLWDRAKSITIPPVVDIHENLIVPTANLLSQESPTFNSNRSIHVVRVLWEYSSLAQFLPLLPDVIELYVWLHETLRFLATKEFAFATSLADIMRKEVLQERFDSVRAHHLLELWDRVSVGFDSFLFMSNNKVNYECEEVSIPFAKLKDAKLICLLSEGSHPSENDFLFLVINDIILKYNSFAEEISPFCTTDSIFDPNRTLSPRFIIRGFGGATKIGSVAPLPLNSLNWVAECSWDSKGKNFDVGKVDALLDNLISLRNTPWRILNPLDNLREKFCFRNDIARSVGVRDATNIVNVDQRGNFYGNCQDYELFEGVYELSLLLDMVKGDGSIRRTLMDLFQGLDYDRIRALLEGCRNVLDELFTSGNSTCFTSLDALLLDFDSRKTQEFSAAQLIEFGFPNMDEKQLRLMLSLNNCQFVELVQYCGFQLASEAHLFSRLPLYVSDPLTEQMRHDLDKNVRLLTSEHSVQTCAKKVDEFVRDVLGFYESQIVEEAAKSDVSFQTFLRANNFCDGSDQFFGVLPKEISLRNYISLRQSLQQIKLSFVSSACEDMESNPTKQKPKEQLVNNTSKHHCWLWEDQSCRDTTEDESNILQPESTRDDCKLWFERGFESERSTRGEGIEVCSNSIDANTPALQDVECSDIGEKNERIAINDVVTNDSPRVEYSKEELALTKLQRWWRKIYKQIEETDLVLYNSINDLFDESDMDYDMNDVNKLSICQTMDLTQCVTETKSTDSDSDVDVIMEIKSSGTVPLMQATYATNDDEIRMRQWLDEHRLPQSMTDSFLSFGVRTIDDIWLLLLDEEDDEVKDLLSSFAPFDRRKLRKAMKSLSSTSSASSSLLASDSDTINSNTNWLDEME